MAEKPIPSQNPENLTDRHAQGPNSIEDSHGHEQHIVAIPTYLTIFAALMVLLVITVAAALFDFARFGPQWAWVTIFVAVTVAVIKSVLILLFFMHLKFSNKVVWLFAGAGFMWLVIMFALGFSDYATRGWIQTMGR